MTKEEYNKSRPNETIIYENDKIVIRLNLNVDKEVNIYIHSKSKDGYEQLPLGYMLGSNMVMYKYKN
ncbi:MAG: hypothetical protein WB562_13470 [Candidatus Sulfotelmatobacter sp.]